MMAGCCSDDSVFNVSTYLSYPSSSIVLIAINRSCFTEYPRKTYPKHPFPNNPSGSRYKSSFNLIHFYNYFFSTFAI